MLKFALRGEWFISPYGDSVFADGNFGDDNHESVALKSKIPDELFEKYQNGQLSADERFDIGEDFLKYMENGGEARTWMVEKESWVRVHGNNFEVMQLNDSTLRSITRFLGEEVSDENFEDEEIYIAELSTNKTYYYTIKQIFNAQDSGNLSGLLLRGDRDEANHPLAIENANLIIQIRRQVGYDRWQQYILPYLANKTENHRYKILTNIQGQLQHISQLDDKQLIDEMKVFAKRNQFNWFKKAMGYG